jgi:menaquinone-dependent protoporphyrinogen oxidase
MKILILFGTSEGQTEKIANHIAGIIGNKGHEVRVECGERLPDDFAVNDFGAVIIGGSIHMGKYQPYVKKFVLGHRDWLNNIPSAFFTVCMGVTSRHAKDRAGAKQYSVDFLQQSGWQPRLTQTFAGAVKYTQYNVITRFIMKMISKREGGSTDTRRDHEYTDWQAVARFAGQFIEQLELDAVDGFPGSPSRSG